jgi:Domain of unknown function(DUF2779)
MAATAASAATATAAPNARRYLTKSLFQRAAACPRKVAYALGGYPERPTSAFVQNLARDGDKVQRYGRIFYPDGIEIPSSTSGTTTAEAVEMTLHLLDTHDHVTLFEAAFLSLDGNCVIRADIVQKRGPTESSAAEAAMTRTTTRSGREWKGEIKLIEVKAKGWDSDMGYTVKMLTSAGMEYLDVRASGKLQKSPNGKRILKKHKSAGLIRSDMAPYVRDVAFQKYVMEQTLTDYTITPYLLLPDKARVNTEVPNLYNLLDEENLTDDVKRQIRRSGEVLLAEIEIGDVVSMITNQASMLSPKLKPDDTSPESRYKTEQQRAEWRSFDEYLHYLSSMIPMSFDDQLSHTSPVPIKRGECRECEFRLGKPNLEDGFDQCWREATDHQYDDVRTNNICDMHHGRTLMKQAMDKGKYFFDQISTEDLLLNEDGRDEKYSDTLGRKGMSLHERQWLQMKGKTDGTEDVVVHRDYLTEEMGKWEYPYHFIDMETTTPVLPFTTGKRPYDPLAFQFSHHILHEDGHLEHATEFLFCQPGQCPNVPFLRALADALEESTGTVFRWGAHENTMVNKLLFQDMAIRGTDDATSIEDRLPFLQSLLRDGDRAMIDLMEVVARSYYVRGSGGSVSLKKVLHPTLQYSPKLKELYSTPTYSSQNYTNMQWWQEKAPSSSYRIPIDPYQLLTGSSSSGDTGEDSSGSSGGAAAAGGRGIGGSSIAHGGDAIRAYSVLQNARLPVEERSAIERSLLRYCELDTLAMAMIMQAVQDFYMDDSVRSL